MYIPKGAIMLLSNLYIIYISRKYNVFFAICPTKEQIFIKSQHLASSIIVIIQPRHWTFTLPHCHF